MTITQQNNINRQILRLSVPSIISNISVPLLGLVDMAITGHLGSEIYIGAISVGGTIFNMIYWIFNFLRFGTGGITSQAFGRRSFEDCALSLLRSLAICMLISLMLICLQTPIKLLSFNMINASNEVLMWTEVYFDICIYGSLGFLGLFAFTGWYVGMQNTKIPLVVSISQNVINIILSLVFVYYFEMGVVGVAYGTLIAQLSGFALAIILCLKYYKKVLKYIDFSKIFDRQELLKFFKINSAIFLRTICVVAVTIYFTIAGATMGDTILAANAVLMQFFMMFTFFIDGFAYAGEAICGKYFGAGNVSALKETIKKLFRFGWIVGGGFTLFYLALGHVITKLLTDQQNVIEVADNHFFWVLLIPLLGVEAFIWDGVYIGCGFFKDMLLCTFVGAIVFFVIWFSFNSSLVNNALWLSFLAYLLSRGLVLRFTSKRKIGN